MLELRPEHVEHLIRGGTLIVPSQQRAAALRLAYSSAQLAAGRSVWSSPDILPWGAWLSRVLEEARARGVPVPRRISAAEEWWLWREAVDQACEDLPVLAAESLIDSIRRSTLLLEDYGLEPREAMTVEAALLLRARSHFQRQCAAAHALWSASWKVCESFLKPATATRLAGFADLGPARRSWLERNGVTIEPGPSLSRDFDRGQRDLFAPEAAVEVGGFDSPELEAEAAADWCAGCLERDPRTRLLLVIPRLAEQRHRWLRALSHRLDYRAILESEGPGDSQFVLEGGQPLGDYSLVATALQLLSLAAGEADFDALSALLRSPFLDPQTLAARLQIDVWLRQHNVDSTHGAALRALLPPIRARLGEPVSAVWRDLLEMFGLASGVPPPATATTSDWARLFAQRLARAGWPGASLDSHEQQIRLRFDELLGEFAALTAGPSALSYAQAVRLLQQLAAGVAFEPASDDVPVTVTASVEDPIVRYDGIWVAGLSADAWPQPARPDPLIPWHWQRKAAMPSADALDPLRRAEQALQLWLHATARLRLSWPRNDGDAPRDPSPLLRDFETPATMARSAPGPTFRLESWMAACVAPLEPWRESAVPLQPAPTLLRGGTRLLELQAVCPFRSFAELRLGAESLTAPQPGIDPRLRGQILHAALERFWRATGDSKTLQARPVPETQELIRECVAAALEDVRRRWPWLPEAAELRREAERDAVLLQLLVDWERARAPFEVVRLEWSESVALAGSALQLRLDRVDRLADGGLIVIDYKSGAAKPFEAEAERPRLPQLLIYAMVAGSQTVAAMALHLNKDGLKLRGIAEPGAQLKGLEAPPAVPSGWLRLQRRWRDQIEQLMREFLTGHAAVQPQPRACEICHLQALCRVQLEPGES